jgi:CheY-like chemotaxis protein
VAGTMSGSGRSEGKARILFVEDEQTVRDHFANQLASEYNVKTVADGEQALRAVIRERPDLIITDLVMPLMGGVELVKTLRNTPSTATIPILIVGLPRLSVAERVPACAAHACPSSASARASACWMRTRSLESIDSPLACAAAIASIRITSSAAPVIRVRMMRSGSLGTRAAKSRAISASRLASRRRASMPRGNTVRLMAHVARGSIASTPELQAD